MKKSKIISKLTDFLRVRPLFAMAVAILLLDICYVNFTFKWPVVATGDAETGHSVTIQGTVRDKTYDENGRIKSIILNNTICYVNYKAPETANPPIDSLMRISGEIKAIDSPMNPGEFNRRYYYGARRIFYELSANSEEILRVPRVGVREFFFKIRRDFSKRIMSFFPLEGGTVNTLICADKSYLPESRRSLYTRVGVGHFLVISGLHISAVGTFIYRGLRRVGTKVSSGCIVTVSFLIMYGLMVGFSVSVVRAVIMFLVRLLADVLKRVYDMMNAVALAALINIVFNPLCIADTAFIYSYATVLMISVYITFISGRTRKPKTVSKRISAALKFPAVLWLFMLPINLYLSFGCSLMSVVANTLLAPLSVPILVSSFLGFALSFTGVTFPTGVADFFIALMLRNFDKLCRLVDGAHIFTFRGRPALWKLCIYYVALLWILADKGRNIGKVLATGALLGLILFVTEPVNMAGRVTTLYVGQGECVVIHMGRGRASVYDCGSTSKSGVGEYILLPYLKLTGVSQVEGIFVSHGDLDHAGEVAYLCEALPREGIVVNHLYTQDIPKSAKSSCLLEAERAAIANRIQVTHLSRGQRISDGRLSFTCLWPHKGQAPEDVNAGSMVIMASSGNFDTLLMGDATKETESIIKKSALAAAKGPIEVLLVSHHGSNTASDAGFIEEVQPYAAVVSAGVNNRYGHPHREVLKRFKDICPHTRLLRTDKSGAVSIEKRGKKTVFYAYRR